ncbi:MAG: DUF2877 domain-containing protein [Microbacterium sp.]|nr:DUF2877 domain-containing protein [Microbacterium sp.]
MMPLVAIDATSWDSALPAALGAAGRPETVVGAVHSVHDRVVNLRIGDGLIALADDVLDDAPCTVRMPFHMLPRVLQGAEARVGADGILVDADGCRLHARLHGDRGWTPPPASGGRVPVDAIDAAMTVLDRYRGLPLQTDLGRASAALLDAGIAELHRTAAILLSAHAASAAMAPSASRPATPHDSAAADHVAMAARRLVGLGEGLTPSGDDILTGLAFLSARPALGLDAMRAPLRTVIGSAGPATSLLSVTTMRAAVEGRGRARLHDLADAVEAGDLRAVEGSAARILEIGHSSGADILTGIRLALDLARVTETPHSPEQHAPHQKENPA